MPNGNLVLKYYFAERSGTRVNDTSPSGLHAQLENTREYESPTRTDGRFGRALAFNGNALLNVGDSTNLLVNSFTLMAWVRYTWVGYPDSSSEHRETRQEIIEKVGSYWMNIRRDGKLRVGFVDCVGGRGQLDSNMFIPENRWTHVAATFDVTDNRIRIYIDGNLDRTSPALAPGTGPPCSDLSMQQHPLTIGGRYSPFPYSADRPVGPDAFFMGTIDEVRVYSSALSIEPLRTASNEGDPHMKTVNGIRYDFQSAGEFVSLRGDGLEIQTRQTAIATTFFPSANAHTGLDTCVSVNTAVAAKVGSHRVTYQPNISSVLDPNGMQLRVDGTLITLDAAGLDLSTGGRIVKSAVGDGIEISFPNGTYLILTPGWWSSQSKWYLNVNIYNTFATQGTLGIIAKGSWLPSLPDGTTMGERPDDLIDRYNALNQTFANAWRVSDGNSLFDYVPGTSTSNFTLSAWPLNDPPCIIPQEPQATPLDLATAQTACASLTNADRKTSCIFDVQVSGETEFAKTYLLTQQLENGATTIVVSNDKDPGIQQEPVVFTATVKLIAAVDNIPSGAVQFEVDGTNVSNSVTLGANGQAKWSTSALALGEHKIIAHFTPSDSTAFLPSRSTSVQHTVKESSKQPNVQLWVLILVLIAVLFLMMW